MLRSVSLVVPKGSVVALLGPNGAGKSTLLGCISGSVRHTHGTIELDGERIDHLPDHLIAQRGVMHLPEGRGIFPTLTVQENLALASHAAGAHALGNAFALFPILQTRLKQPAGTLSGGEQQMLAVARALIKPPRLLLADEPSLGLAPMLAAEIYSALRRVRDEGSSILLVEQYAQHALCIADIVVVLRQGRVCFIGEPAEVVGNETLLDSYFGRSPVH
ncbi:MAG: ABC transporter ATP-binding protein [Actinomycetota bacterium]